MNAAHVHLLLNHFPITGGLIALALLAYGWVRRNDVIVRAAAVLFVAIALLTVVTFLSGEPAEHVLEAGPGVAENLVHEHEEAGQFALILYGVLGVLSLYTLVRYARRAVPRSLGGVLLVVAAVTVAAAARVGWLGGPIVHEEVRSGAVAPTAEAAEDDED
jgi:uncharacterized membrane protein